MQQHTHGRFLNVCAWHILIFISQYLCEFKRSLFRKSYRSTACFLLYWLASVFKIVFMCCYAWFVAFDLIFTIFRFFHSGAVVSCCNDNTNRHENRHRHHAYSRVATICTVCVSWWHSWYPVNASVARVNQGLVANRQCCCADFTCANADRTDRTDRKCKNNMVNTTRWIGVQRA